MSELMGSFGLDRFLVRWGPDRDTDLVLLVNMLTETEQGLISPLDSSIVGKMELTEYHQRKLPRLGFVPQLALQVLNQFTCFTSTKTSVLAVLEYYQRKLLRLGFVPQLSLQVLSLLALPEYKSTDIDRAPPACCALASCLSSRCRRALALLVQKCKH